MHRVTPSSLLRAKVTKLFVILFIYNTPISIGGQEMQIFSRRGTHFLFTPNKPKPSQISNLRQLLTLESFLVDF